jgi:hypothetical protein
MLGQLPVSDLESVTLLPFKVIEVAETSGTRGVWVKFCEQGELGQPEEVIGTAGVLCPTDQLLAPKVQLKLGTPFENVKEAVVDLPGATTPGLNTPEVQEGAGTEVGVGVGVGVGVDVGVGVGVAVGAGFVCMVIWQQPQEPVATSVALLLIIHEAS